jgi:MSHA pilin protein MshD
MNNLRQRGFTLIELIIFIVVVSAGMAGILKVMDTTVKSSADPMVRKQAAAIAGSLLEEILLKDYAKDAASTALAYPSGARNQFDCVSDYAGYTTTSGIVYPDAAATPVPGLSSYNISPVSVASVTASESSLLADVGAKKITVIVTGPGVSISLTGYRALY